MFMVLKKYSGLRVQSLIGVYVLRQLITYLLSVSSEGFVLNMLTISLASS